MSRIATPGSLTPLMDQVVAIGRSLNAVEGLADDQQLHVYRWKPSPTRVQFPALWHWLTGGPPPEMRDLNRLRDHVQISAYIGTRHTDQDRDMEALEAWSDAYRDAADPALFRTAGSSGGLLNGTATWASRQGMRLVSVEFGGTTAVAFELPLEFWLDRQIIKTG